MWNALRGSAVLVTGGTRGIGLATGLAFGARGAEVFLTQKWGGSDPDEIRAAFVAAGAKPPAILDADASRDDDARAVLEAIRASGATGLHALISNVAFAPAVKSFDDYTKRGLQTGIDYSTWPMVAHTRIAREVFGAYPKYVVGVTSQATHWFGVGYDVIAGAKAALEAIARYMHYRLAPHGTRVNLLSTRYVDTEALRATFGEDFPDFCKKLIPDVFASPEDCGTAIAALCSGLMDGVGGQIVTVDRGGSVFDSLGRMYDDTRRAT